MVIRTTRGAGKAKVRYLPTFGMGLTSWSAIANVCFSGVWSRESDLGEVYILGIWVCGATRSGRGLMLDSQNR